MRRFDLLQPKSLAEAVEVLQGMDSDARVIAGGTALMVLMKGGVYAPSCLVSLGRISGLDRIEIGSEGNLRIGALVTQRQVETDSCVRSLYPTLVEAVSQVGNIRIKNMATLVGNLAHADYQSDPPPALLVLGASLEVIGPEGTRVIPLAKFFQGPYETNLQTGEIVTAIVIPQPEAAAAGAYLKFTTRSAADRTCVGVAVQLMRKGNSLANLQVALGAVAGVPYLVNGLTESFQGRQFTAEFMDEVAELAAQGIEPFSDLRGSAAYKKQMIQVFVRRSLKVAWERAMNLQEVS